MTTTTYSYNPQPTKRDILKRLFEANHINFDELWTLIHGDTYSTFISPITYGEDFTITSSDDNDNQRVHNSTGGVRPPESH